MEEQVRSKVDGALLLPKPCKTTLVNFITPIGKELVCWCLYYQLDGCSFKLLDTLLPQQLRWTMRGTVDYAKTAELLVDDERVDVVKRYEVACLNCLEDAARRLIKFIPEERRYEYVGKLKAHIIARRIEYKRFIIGYFTYTLTADAHLLNSFLQSLQHDLVYSRMVFKGILLNGDRAICEYWFKKLSHGKKERVLDDKGFQLMSLRLSCTSSLLYYSSQMNEEQRRRMFRECTCHALIGLLRWPMQSLFMEAAVSSLSFLGQDDYSSVVHTIINNIGVECLHDFDYSQLFWEFWRLSPAEYQQHFLNDTDHLEDLFATKRTEFIRLGLNRAHSHQLKELTENRYEKIGQMLMDESIISDAALMECKETAALNSENDKENEEKRLRSEHVNRFVDLVLESRMERRGLI